MLYKVLHSFLRPVQLKLYLPNLHALVPHGQNLTFFEICDQFPTRHLALLKVFSSGIWNHWYAWRLFSYRFATRVAAFSSFSAILLIWWPLSSMEFSGQIQGVRTYFTLLQIFYATLKIIPFGFPANWFFYRAKFPYWRQFWDSMHFYQEGMVCLW